MTMKKEKEKKIRSFGQKFGLNNYYRRKKFGVFGWCFLCRLRDSQCVYVCVFGAMNVYIQERQLKLTAYVIYMKKGRKIERKRDEGRGGARHIHTKKK